MQGQTDVPLNATGVEQALAAKARLAARPIVTVCSSPLGRARETARIVNRALGCPVVEIEALGECGFGVHEAAEKGTWYDDWLAGITPSGAESYDAFAARAIAGINQALGHSGPVLIVAHGGVYRALERASGASRIAVVPNAVPTRHDPPMDGAAAWTVTVLGQPVESQ